MVFFVSVFGVLVLFLGCFLGNNGFLVFLVFWCYFWVAFWETMVFWCFGVIFGLLFGEQWFFGVFGVFILFFRCYFWVSFWERKKVCFVSVLFVFFCWSFLFVINIVIFLQVV